MKEKAGYIRAGVLVLLSATILFVLKLFLDSRPMQFMFVSGIVLAVLFFWIQNKRRSAQDSSSNLDLRLMKENRVISVIFILFLFVVSLVVMKKYQHPNPDKAPYFTNTHHHAVKNTGIAFDHTLSLYEDEATDGGIWKSDTGSFILTANGDAVDLRFSHFFQPVFVKTNKQTIIINPVFSEPIQNNFVVSDPNTSLCFTMLHAGEEQTKEDQRQYDIQISFSTSDSTILQLAETKPKEIYTDTFIVSNLTIKKGLLLGNLLDQMSSSNPLSHDLANKWLQMKEAKMFVLNSGQGLTFFPTAPFFNNHDEVSGQLRATINGAAAKTQFNTYFTYNVSNKKSDSVFYVGFSSTRKPMVISKIDTGDARHLPGMKYLLAFDYPAYYSLSSNYNTNNQIGDDQLRFLRNNFTSNDTLMRTEEGFFFHDDVKDNDFTHFESYLSYKIGAPGTDLHPELINFRQQNLDSVWQTGEQTHFGIHAGDKTNNIVWLFELRDFSKNKFAYNSMVIYLCILAGAMLILIIFFPSVETRRIETPLLIMTYCMIVFRLLLLWRVATFPPMEDIGNTEFETLQSFDLISLGSFTIPFTILMAVIVITLICLYRALGKYLPDYFNKAKAGRWHKWRFVVYHGMLLFFLIPIVHFKIGGDKYIRLCSIVLPLLSYFYFTAKIQQQKIVFEHTITWHKFKPISFFRELIRYWAETPVFFLSMSTLIFLGLTDTGFAIIFLFFLFFKNILINFSRRPNQQGDKPLAMFFKPQNYWIYGILFLGLYLLVVAYKPAFDVLLQHKILLICVMMCLGYAILFMLIDNKKIRMISGGVVLALMLLVSLPFRNIVENAIDKKIRLTVYRTQILTKPINDILFQYEYNSNQEKKLIETAQNQWYIANYLDAPIEKGPIHMRPHFNTGVDYSTQTRDVVLPRYVISEFGPVMMALVLAMIALPLLLYFLSYRIVDPSQSEMKQGRFVSVLHTESFRGAAALMMLFTIALMVWLTSTNRIVFFGQDFPFLSLTSKVSVITPLLLVLLVLISKPLERGKTTNYKSYFIRWAGFAVMISVVLMLSQKPNEFSDKNKNFKIDYSAVSTTVSSMDSLFQVFQDEHPTKGTDKKEFQQLMTGFFASPECTSSMTGMKESNSYQFSLLDSLRKNPLMGTSVNSPVYVKYNEISKHYSIEFNEHTNTEAPPYEIEKRWKGNIMAENFNGLAEKGRLNYVNKNGRRDKVRLIAIPSNYLEPGKGNIGIVDATFKNEENKPVLKELMVYNCKTKKFSHRNQNAASFAISYDELIIKKYHPSQEEKGNSLLMLPSGPDQAYFAKNFIINGKQRFVYPMGEQYYWIRNWAEASSYKINHRKSYDSTISVTLDYNLTKEVLNLTEPLRKEYSNGSSFAVIAADGDGKIRLMVDMVKEREIIDPNSEALINKKRQEEFFFVNSKKESQQWGNKNLIFMEDGPGSSVKPLIAASVSAGVNAGWEKIFLDAGGETTDHYAGISFKKHPWKEDHGFNKLEFNDYISVSDNFYHSVIFFLSNYTKKDFINNTNNSYSIKSVLTKNGLFDDNDFPKITIDNESYYFPSFKNQKRKWPLTDNLDTVSPTRFFANPDNLLSIGLPAYLNLPVEEKYYNANPIKLDYNNQEDSNMLFPLAYPDRSSFLNKQLICPIENNNFKSGFLNAVHGGSIYSITPKKMIDMYASFFSQDKNYCATIESKPGLNKTKATWIKDESWHSEIEYQEFLSDNIIKGMENVSVGKYDGSHNGTAATWLKVPSLETRYHIYAKTGTTGSGKDDKVYSSKRLAVIISKEPFMPQNIGKNKYYIIYFTADKMKEKNLNPWYYNPVISVLGSIINSASFKLYMNEKEQ